MEFKRTIRKIGKSYMVTIPKAYVKNGELVLGEEYNCTLTKI